MMATADGHRTQTLLCRCLLPHRNERQPAFLVVAPLQVARLLRDDHLASSLVEAARTDLRRFEGAVVASEWRTHLRPLLSATNAAPLSAPVGLEGETGAPA